MILHWSASPEILTLGPLRLRWYGLMFLAGFLIGFQLMKWVCAREKKDGSQLESLLVHLVLGTTIGARLGHCLFYDPLYYLSHPLEILKIWEGGLASHGGGIGVILSLVLFSRKNPEFGVWWLLDRISIFTVMTGSFIRIGNLMNSEILGRPTGANWGVVFTRVDQIPRHPAMVYESVWYMAVFALTFGLYRRFGQKMRDGFYFGLVISLIMTGRFFIEFYKEAQEAFERSLPINMGQILSLPFIVVGMTLVIRALAAGPVETRAPNETSKKSTRKRGKNR